MKPIKVFYSHLSKRFYATRAYKQNANGTVNVTGDKFDVTNDIGGIVTREGITFTERKESQDGK